MSPSNSTLSFGKEMNFPTMFLLPKSVGNNIEVDPKTPLRGSSNQPKAAPWGKE